MPPSRVSMDDVRRDISHARGWIGRALLGLPDNHPDRQRLVQVGSELLLLETDIK